MLNITIHVEIVDLNYNVTSYNRMVINENKYTVVERMWSKGSPCALLEGMQIAATTVENSTGGSSKNSKWIYI